MDTAPYSADNAPMTEDEADQLFKNAAQLAHDMFDGATDEHVMAVFERLVWNQRRGLEDAGAMTVH